MNLEQLLKDIKKFSDPKRAEAGARYFKTKEGEYGYGDIFAGLTVPQCRQLAVKYKALSLLDVEKLLISKIHEQRLIALFLLVYDFSKGDEKEKKGMYEFYLSHTRYINNWDLVDSSAPQIVGIYLLNKPRSILKKLAKSKDVWERRIAILSTMAFIAKAKEYEDTFVIAEILLHDNHDLIHKAVGWLLREVGKRIGQKVEEDFLKKHYKDMPRTMLRYSIEHFDEKRRLAYLRGRI